MRGAVRGAGPCGNIGQRRLIGAVRRAAAQHEPAITIPAIDIAVLINFEIDARMAKRRRTKTGTAANAAGPVAANAVRIDQQDFRRGDVHGACRYSARAVSSIAFDWRLA